MKETIQSLSQDTVQRLKKKGQERLTIMIIPHGQDKVFSLQLNWYLIIFCSAILLLLITLSFYGIYESRVRKQELNRLNELYGVNFKSALKLENQSIKLKNTNETLHLNLVKISKKLGVVHATASILPDLETSESAAIKSLSKNTKNAVGDNVKITYLPPIYELKTVQNQIVDKSPLVHSLQYFFSKGYGVFQKIPMGRPFIHNETLRDSSAYGARSDPFNQLRFEFHPGYDTRGPIGSVIQSTAKGIVFKVMNSRYGGYGRAVIIQHEFGYYTLYAHLSRVHVQKGDEIQKNQLIGELGSTGRSTGPHIHYEIRYNQLSNHIEPLSYMCAMDYETSRCILYHEENKSSAKKYFINN